MYGCRFTIDSIGSIIEVKELRDINESNEMKLYLENEKIQMPVHFLQESGKGFFVKREGAVLALCEDLKEIVRDKSFRIHFKDVIDFRTMDYYKRRYDKL